MPENSPLRLTPQLRQALTELLEQKVTVPDALLKFCEVELDVKDGKYIYDVPTTTWPGFPGACQTRLANPMTVRELLSALPRIFYRDLFTLEKTRNTHFDDPEYQRWRQIEGLTAPDLNRYLTFFTTMTNIVDKNQIPNGLSDTDIPDVLRKGWIMISALLKDVRKSMEQRIEMSDPAKIMKRQAFATAEGILKNAFPVTTSEKLQALKEEVSRIKEEYWEHSETVRKLADYLMENNLVVVFEPIKKTAAQGVALAQDSEDIAAFLGNIAARIKVALQTGGISTRSGTDYPLGL